jgi:hypothetical protein
MSERLKKLVGDELYGKIEEAAKAQNVKVKDIDVVANNFVPKNRFDEINEELKSTKGKIESYNTQLTNIETVLKGVNVENVGDLIGKYNTVKETHAQELSKKDLEINNIKKTSMVKEFLTKEGAKHTDLLIKSINFEDIKIDGDKLIGASDVVKNLKTEYKDLFVEKVASGTPPKNTDKDGTAGTGGTGEKDIFDQLLSGNAY